MHSLLSPSDKIKNGWIMNFTGGHAIEDSNDFLDTNATTPKVQELNQRDILEYVSVKDSM